VTVLGDLRQIAVAMNYTVGLRQDGTVWQWGRLANATMAVTPVQVPGLEGVTQVCAQGSTTSYGLALRNDGTVWFWGHDVAGALPGQGSSRIDVLMVPVQVAGLRNVTGLTCAFTRAFAIGSDGSVRTWGSNVSGGYAFPRPADFAPRSRNGADSPISMGSTIECRPRTSPACSRYARCWRNTPDWIGSV
jgi:alpha-tubulin suppressor-like RCC1 family protein